MNYFIQNIRVNELFHLRHFDIPIQDARTPHLILTGKNGSGKTVLLNAIADYLEKDILRRKSDKVEVSLNNILKLATDFQKGDFLVVFYQADRKCRMIETKTPTKPDFKKVRAIRETSTSQFLNFLSDLKIQEALARNEQQMDDAEQIHQWFVGFENLLKRIYQDEQLALKFNYRDYSFQIQTEGKAFKFTEMSDGFAAVLDIVADLILKMQEKDSLVRAYEKTGIVLIDEVETHLHLELQRIIMPLLTEVFPNIQFIVTTHSPFVLNSMNNAVAFDLEHQEVIGELTEYSYEALAEGYFGVKTDSSYMEMQLDMLKALLDKPAWTDADKVTIRQLVDDFDKVPEAVSPAWKGRYLQLKSRFASRIKEVLP